LRGSMATQRVSSFGSAEIYNPDNYPSLPRRPGSEDFLEFPSRMGDKLYYRDGRIKNIKD
jgi:hypothetical protein